MDEYKDLQRENSKTRPDKRKIRSSYETIVSNLETLEIDLSELCALQHSFGGQRMVHAFYLPPTLPSSFDEFSIDGTSDPGKDGLSPKHLSAIAASMIMGEERDGIECVPEKYRDRVRHEILRVLANTVFESPEFSEELIADLDTAIYRDELRDFTDSDDQELGLTLDYMSKSRLDYKFADIIAMTRELISSNSIKKIPKSKRERERLVKEFYAKAGGRNFPIIESRTFSQRQPRDNSPNSPKEKPWESTYVKPDLNNN